MQIPEHLRCNHRVISAEAAQQIEMSIRANYHKGWRAESRYSPDGYKADLAAHLYDRLNDDRGRIIPWLDHARPLRGSRILEIGCGTGSSTVALAEQGAVVTAIDIDEDALLVARDRCAAYGIEATFMPLNSQRLIGAFQIGSFDLIVFFACLEHMTTQERLDSLRQAWDLLPSNGLLAIIETPNRLWFYDEHTSWLPLFHWLPNDLAFQYSKMSKRENFRELYRDYLPETKQHFLRRGRGMSFHEIDLAIAPVATINVISSLEEFRKYPRGTVALGKEFKAIMRRLLPDIHTGFFDEYLDLIFKKGERI